MIKREKDTRQIKIIVCCIISAILPLMICSKNSFLYPFNDWPDINVFFTVGKGMIHGKVPYVDLIDPKGPYLYVLSAISYLISRTGFFGFFLFECLSISVFLYYSYKVICLYCKANALWILPVLSASVVCAKSFVHGGSLEELCFGFFVYAIYTLLDFLHSDENNVLTKRTIVVNALGAGIIFWSKFTLVGLYIGWGMVVVVVYLWRKKYREIGVFVAYFLLTVFIVTLPCIIYFAWNNALKQWLEYYLWNNVFAYSSNESVSIFTRMGIAIKNALLSLKDSENWSYSIVVVFGGIGYVLLPAKRVPWREKIAVAVLAICMVLGIFIGGTKHDYYGLPLAVFIVFGGLVMQILAERVGKAWSSEKWSRFNRIGFAVVLLLSLLECMILSPNVYLMNYKKDEMPQYRFAAQIQESQDTSMLNYDFLDGGFYTVLNQVPEVRYFCVLNVNRGEIMAEQTSYVEQQLTQWLVTWKAYEMTEEDARQLAVVTDYYDLVDYQYFFLEGDMRTYLLYKRKP